MLPLCRKLKTVHGPHSTCLMTAETFWRQHPYRHSRALWLHLSPKSCRSVVFSRHWESLVYLGSFLWTLVLFSLLALGMCVGVVSVRLSLRFQAKLTLYLVMLQRIPVGFNAFNVACIICLQLVRFLCGGFGFFALSFVDT